MRNPVIYKRDTATGNFGNPDNFEPADDGLDSEGYPLGQPREWSEEELAELRRRNRATDDYGSM